MTIKTNRIYIALLLISGIISGVILSFLIFGKMSFAGGQGSKAVPRKTEFITTHTLCGHESIYAENSDIQAVFSDEQEIKNTFPEWTLNSVSNEKIVLKKSVPNYCPDHFFAYLKDKKIHIETLNGDKKDVLNVAALSFTEEEEKTLTDGIYINGKEMYTAFIEDFTS